ncbi:asparaginase [Limnohabitans sp.]|uniref:asparaginase n=1 Tax=Limnohabitans sp. TaxID=1907725 RepID=UPI00286F4CE7|nr:asparaginase [Limnohabitans sp.]
MNVKKIKKIVVLATGGTIAGLAMDVDQPQNYKAAQVNVAQLLHSVVPAGLNVLTEQVAQIDSKDMSFAVWQSLLERVAHWAAQDEVQGVVITHGTDTLEETAYFLQAVLQPNKPVALTCAMLPANAPESDGTANLKEAFSWVQSMGSVGVSVVCAGQVHTGLAVQKSHSHKRNPFTSQAHVSHPASLQIPSVAQVLACTDWPHVALVFNHVGADGRMVRTLMAHDAPDGWVAAGTGNGTLHHDLEAALLDAQKQGAHVLRASRCAWGGVQSRDTDVLPYAGLLTAVQARVALVLDLIARRP